MAIISSGVRSAAAAALWEVVPFSLATGAGNLERLIWSCGTQAEIAALLKAGFQPPDDERLQAKAKRAQQVTDARHQREIARQAQKQESDNRKHQRAAKPVRKGTRPPLVNNDKSKARTAIPTTDEGWLDAQIESMIKNIQAKAVKQSQPTVAI